MQTVRIDDRVKSNIDCYEIQSIRADLRCIAKRLDRINKDKARLAQERIMQALEWLRREK